MKNWLTYDEAAELLGISAEATRCRAKRQRWPRTRGNDGRARIKLPEALQDAATDRATPGRPGETTAPVTGPVTAPDDAGIVARVAALETEVRMLRELLEEVRANRDDLRAERDRLLAGQRKATTAPMTTTSPSPARRATPAPAPAVAPPEAHFVSQDDMSTAAGLSAIRQRIERELARRDAETDDDDASASRH